MVPIALLLALATLLGCAQEGDTQRPEPQRSLALVEREGVTRPAFEVAADEAEPLVLTARDVGAGAFRTWLAARDTRGRDATASVRVGEDTCERSFGLDAAWQPCEIPVLRARDVARAEIRYAGPTGSALFVAAPVFEADASPDEKPPVVVVVLDTARADGFRSFNPESAIGDALAALARDGITFTRARAPSGWTRTSVATLLTGQSPFTHHVLDRLDVLGPEGPSLAARLREAGYRTHGWTTNPNVLPRWGFARGFDAFEDVGTQGWALVKPDGDRVLDGVEAEIAQGGLAGRLLYVHLMDPHQPYRPKPPSLEQLDEKTRGRYALPAGAGATRGMRTARLHALLDKYRSYLGELLETDAHVGRLLDLLRANEAYDASLVVVVSDHGEEFLDHGGTGHGKTLYEEMLRVPLWLKLPGNRLAGTRIERDVDLADLLPTLLTALDLPLPEGLDGVDLLSEGDGSARPQLARLKLERADLGAVVHDGWKLLIDLTTGTERLYALADDPTEQTDLREAHPDRAGALRAAFDARRFEQERGWHVRGCGGTRGGRLVFRLELGTEPEIETRGLEETDRIDADARDGERRVVLDLARVPHPTERLLTAMRPTLPDEDELLLRAPPRALRAEGETPLAIALGAADAIEHLLALEPELHLERARVPAGRSVRCAERDAPYLQVWRVDPPPAPPQAVDPALAERLRALGYGE